MNYDFGDLNADLGRLNAVLGQLNASLRSRLPATWANGTVRDAAKFRGVMDEFRVEISKRAGQAQQKLLLEVYAGLVQATPVGNATKWKRNIERASRGLPPLPKNYVGGTARRGWALNTGGGDPLTVAVGPLSSATITNKVPYMQRLNEGWSKQAPAGFIEQVIARVLAKYPGGKVA